MNLVGENNWRPISSLRWLHGGRKGDGVEAPSCCESDFAAQQAGSVLSKNRATVILAADKINNL